MACGKEMNKEEMNNKINGIGIDVGGFGDLPFLVSIKDGVVEYAKCFGTKKDIKLANIENRILKLEEAEKEQELLLQAEFDDINAKLEGIVINANMITTMNKRIIDLEHPTLKIQREKAFKKARK